MPLVISFIVPIFRYTDLVAPMLLRLRLIVSQLPGSEIILIDDASPPETIRYLLGIAGQDTQLFFNSKNLGFGGACNAAAARAKGDLIFFLNSDLELTIEDSWWFEIAEHFYNGRGNVGLLGSVHVEYGSGKVNHIGIDLNLHGDLVHVISDDSIKSVRDCFAVSGALIAVERVSFSDLGGFDHSFINGCEDVDLCFRYRQIGKSVQVNRKSVLTHHLSKSRGFDRLRDERNSHLLYAKWESIIEARLASLWGSYLTKMGADERARIFYRFGFDSGMNSECIVDKIASSIAHAVLQRKFQRWFEAHHFRKNVL